ncbi:helix-turn-helix transcriptional regulator [Microbacterium indicum]|uniref:helix-turn-helix transcriptional regulator n=1 Tax=Microbacterium indicum TaxID=358100 RepID=UPI00041BAF1D|nr:helix-turn-helix transcriptional regulator [Microbacterium indicum]
MDREALAAFLVRHREDLRPADVGLPAGPRRRTPGLRREEVAQLAAMSTDYYARLEQRRGPQPSVAILDAIARALRLSADERDYLHRVAGHSAPDRRGLSDYVAPALMRVMDRLTDVPALILDGLATTLVMNEPARALFGDETAFTGLSRSAVYRWFADPQARRVYPERDHARHSRQNVAGLRAAHAVLGPDSKAGEIVRALLPLSDEFRGLWEQQIVARRFEDHKVVVHPEIGDIEVDCQALFTEDETQVLLVLTAPPGSDDAGKLDLLRVVGTQEMAG